MDSEPELAENILLGELVKLSSNFARKITRTWIQDGLGGRDLMENISTTVNLVQVTICYALCKFFLFMVKFIVFKGKAPKSSKKVTSRNPYFLFAKSLKKISIHMKMGTRKIDLRKNNLNFKSKLP
jgi:hypothetical protein